MREELSIEPSCLFLTLHDFFLVGITICRWVLHNSASLTVVTCGLRKKKKKVARQGALSGRNWFSGPSPELPPRHASLDPGRWVLFIPLAHNEMSGHMVRGRWGLAEVKNEASAFDPRPALMTLGAEARGETSCSLAVATQSAGHPLPPPKAGKPPNWERGLGF